MGHAYESSEIQSLVRDWEQLEWVDEEDIDAAHVDGRLSLMNRDLGLYLFFTTADRYTPRYGPPQAEGSLVLARIVFLLHFGRGFSPFSGPLPLGLSPAEHCKSIAQHANRPVREWLTGGRVCKARWQTDHLEVDVSFNTQGIKLVSATPALRTPGGNTPLMPLPTPAEFVDLFGMPLSSLRHRPELKDLQLGSRVAEINTYGEADFSAEHGIELYFKPGGEIDRSIYSGPQTKEPCLSGLRYRVDLDFQSTGYKGSLPKGLDFDDPVEVAAAKVDMPPDQESFDEHEGYQRWHLARTDLHVLYSLMEDRIYRVTLLAHGCYE
jgi:hypothetical protein